MCGIVACRTAEPAAPYLVRALGLLEYRGYDSAGIAVQTGDGIAARLRTVKRVGDLETQLAGWDDSALSGVGIGHTRWATHGSVTEGNAHPHSDCHDRLSVVHNGIIENATALRRELELSGHVFASEVDSEVISHLVEEAIVVTDDLLTAVRLSVDRLEGSWALVAMDAATGRLVAAAHRSPLLIAHSPHGDFVSSDVAAIAEWVDDFRTMRDGDVVEIADTLLWENHGVATSAPEPIASPWLRTELAHTDHADFMSKEIGEQPEVAARILDELTPGIADGSLWRALELPPFDRIAIVGCGTSLNAGRVIGTAFSRHGHVPHSAIVASEASSTIVEPRTLVLAISQSGETADVLRAIDQVDLGLSSLVAITNNPHSTLARRADSVIDSHAGPEVGVAATKTFVAQIVTGVCFALSALVATDRVDRYHARWLADDLALIPDLLAQSLAVSLESVPPLVARLHAATGYLFLGRGAGVVYAAEGALKLKELSYRWAEHYPAGELKHGPLALVEPGTPVIVIDNDDPRLEGNIAEVRARGGEVLRIGSIGSDIPALGRGIAEPRRGGIEAWGPLESVVPLQVFARQLALELGRDVDKPRNLAKSVTVD
ncbi:glutamine--fructose-6-phosphate transaminase (isomerizing) [Compostimonas suwonensis]|uniref:Glutamine--fructose-6-phosphate aminotransferase [isomerizing] n=1 Tax=Compostimonas suwonensis TaxID=1048394 RepID=A0A2M9BWM9_9MICO|nr:glutamine--fructose-6-phosphate transaminase (isomerizing) [Compostimonas suwonensis]PJJ62334.1 glucosamine--fructose-6-phosphate aminotransferase (isomerizing) [Compostimonas suwonensis]